MTSIGNSVKLETQPLELDYVFLALLILWSDAGFVVRKKSNHIVLL